MKIVILDGGVENPGDLSWEGFEGLGECTVYNETSDDRAEIIARIADNQAVIVNKVRITRDILEACPTVEYIGLLSTGFDVVDIQAAAEKGIPVCNVPSYATSGVAQHVFALLLELCHRIGHHDAAVKGGKWAKSGAFCFWDYPMVELKGKTMGIVGYGRIGRKTAEIAKAFDMDILVYDKFMPLSDDIASYRPLDELFAFSDVISLNLPLTPETRGLINRDTIAEMREGVIIINTSRGGLINEADLADALNTGKVGGAALDVVSEEPIRPDNPLLTAKNTIISPHIAWASRDSRKRLMDSAVLNLIAYLDGEPRNVVNFG